MIRSARRSVLLVVLLAPRCASVDIQPAAPHTVPSRAAAQAVARVPFELNGNSMFLQLSVNGHGPLWFVLDTGAQGSVLNARTVKSLGLGSRGGAVAVGAGGQVEATRVSDVTFDLAGARLEGLEVAGVSLTLIENAMGRKVDGILGAELLRRFVVEIDHERKEIDLYEPASFDDPGSGEALPLTFSDNHPYVHAKVQLPGRDEVEGEFVLDSGSNFQLILLPSFIEEKGLRKSLPPTISTFGRGVGGEIPMPIGRADTLRLGRFTIERPVTAFPSGGTFGHTGKAGNIGGAVLRRFKVTFDYSRSRMILEPNQIFAEPYEYDMSGLVLVSESPAFAVVRVHRVLAGSPAEEAGLKPGDEIVSVDGGPAAELKLAALRELLRQEGRRVALRVKRGAEEISVELATRRLI